MHVPGQRRGAAIAADLGSRNGVGLVVRAEAAMLFGNRDAEQAGAVQILVVLGGKFCVAVVSRGALRKYALPKLPRNSDDRALLPIQPTCLRIENRRVRERGGCFKRAGGLHAHASGPLAADAVRRKSPSTALNSSGCSSGARWPTPSSST